MSDPFKTDSGIVDDYSGSVVQSWFGINPRYNETLHLLFWRIKLDNPEEYPQIEDGEIQEQFTIGPNWESLDGGSTVEYPGKPEARFNGNTQYGHIINRAVGDWNLRDQLTSKGDGPTQAVIWEGLRFKFESEQLAKPFKNAAGELVTPGPKVMPVQYLGEGESVEREVAFDLSTLGLSDEEEGELRKAAEGASSYGQFLDAAMKLQWVSGNGKMVSALADQSLWQTIRLL